MCIARCVLAVVVLHVGVVHSWDFAVSLGDQLMFYEANGIKAGTVRFKSQTLEGLAYDEVHNMMLYVDKQNGNDAVCGYNLYSKENVCFIERNGRNIHSIAYDPATEKIFFTDNNENSINWVSLKRGYKNNVYGNLLIKMDDGTPSDISVDSCSGYIYWSNRNNAKKEDMERARLNGSEREALHYNYTEKFDVLSLAIDPQTQKMYYIDRSNVTGLGYYNIANLNGEFPEWKLARKNLTEAKELSVSIDYSYWTENSYSYKSVWRLQKKAENNTPIEISRFYTNSTLGMVTNYKLNDQIKGVLGCATPSSLTQITEVSGFTIYSGFNDERREVCEKYCLKGNCSVNDVGLPKCGCNAGYTGERCEISACHSYCLNDGTCSLNENSDPVCHCKGDYSGDRCEITDCLNYCMQGNCSFNDEGYPKCSCNAGYSGERCEVSACHSYCLNDGNCSLNKEDEPVCQCVGYYEGSRCEVVKNNTFTNTTTITLAELLSNWRKPTAKVSVTVEV